MASADTVQIEGLSGGLPPPPCTQQPGLEIFRKTLLGSGWDLAEPGRVHGVRNGATGPIDAIPTHLKRVERCKSYLVALAMRSRNPRAGDQPGSVLVRKRVGESEGQEGQDSVRKATGFDGQLQERSSSKR